MGELNALELLLEQAFPLGAQQGQALRIPGGDGPGIWTGTEYLARINRGEPAETGGQVIVVGGGNTAIDAARCARRTGATVTILYRRSREEMPAIAEEVDEVGLNPFKGM